MEQSNRPRYFVYSLEKGLAILTAFSKKGPKLKLSEIAQATDMVPPTATRFIRTLEDLGYLVRDGKTKSYSLSPKVLSLGFNLLKNMDLRARVTPYLAEVAHDFGIGSQCAILDGTEIVYIERLRSLALVSLDLTIGSRLPAYCTALGRAILAFMDTELVQSIVAKTHMTPLTSHTIVGEDDFYRELDLTRKRGYAINVQELVLGQAALAAPVFHSGIVEGALGFSFPHTFMEDKKFTSALVKRMLQIADKVSLG
jgi:IclR family pca regulon transcriptional regulator